ncbi:MAG: glycosyl hydrolase family 16, partial [Flavobacteriaceae bacterium]|nr:glycosyl hydrolase family 16 [Flavobacteriaceae bacterium]
MKNRNLTYRFSTLLLGFLFLAFAGCEREFSNEVEFATFNNNSDIFIDGFSGGLEYLPFGGSKLDAFSVDTETRYKGESSMRFDVPNVGNPDGSFAGAIFP